LRFRYVALDQSGLRTKGSIEAASLLDARAQILEENTAIIKIKKTLSSQKKLTPKLTLRWTEGLEQLIDSGLSLRDSLLLLIKESKGIERSLSQEALRRIESGETFSTALKKAGFAFDPFYITMIEASEKTGKLADNLKYLKEVLSQKESLKKKLTSALIYPAFLLSFCIGALIFILVQVIPSIEELIILEKAPMVTRWVLKLSHGIREHWDLLILAIGIAITSALVLKKRFMQLFFNLPFIRTLQKLTDLQQISHLSAALLKADVGLFDTLSLSESLVKTQIYKEALIEAGKNLLQGVLLSETLRAHKKQPFPELFIQRIAIGEKSADLKTAFARLAKVYDERLSSIYGRISTLVQPILILLLAGLVGGVMLAVLIPLTDFGSLDL
jgi:type II secretory pathway component PulF